MTAPLLLCLPCSHETPSHVPAEEEKAKGLKPDASARTTENT
jgi:hypothetical protein